MVSKKIINTVTACCILIVCITLVTPIRIYARSLYLVQSLILVSAAYYLFIIIKALLKKSEDAWYFLFGFMVMAIATLFEILHVNLKIYSGYLIPFGLFTFIITQTIILSMKFTRLYLKSERLSTELTEYSMLLENKIKARTLELEQSNEQKTTLFVNLAHEIKTPITLMDNYLDRYLNKKGTITDLKIVKSNIHKLKKDVINYLDLEKTDRGNIIYSHDSILNLSQILTEKTDVFQDPVRRKGFKLQVDIAENLYIKASRNALERILNNLLDNSIKYCIKHGSIKVELSSTDEAHHRLCISNNSEGIGPEELENIFKPYYQLSHQKSNTQGMGMGLAIVKSITEEIGATIGVESTPDGITSFTIMFVSHHLQETDVIETGPEEEEYQFSTTNIVLQEETYDEARETIFIVEDNLEMLAYLQSNLNQTYNVYYALNGEKALLKIKWIPKPRVIISDIMMDVMDGFEFCKKLKTQKEYADIPFIFLTARTRGEEKLEGLDLGAIDYIYKPFIIDEVRAKIKSLINQYNQQEEQNLKKFEKKISGLLRENPDENYDEKITTYNLLQKEHEILELLVAGYENKEIAARLNISVSTVKRRLHNVYQKCGVSNKIELINIIKG